MKFIHAINKFGYAIPYFKVIKKNGPSMAKEMQIKELSVKQRISGIILVILNSQIFGLLMVSVIYAIEQLVMLIQTKPSKIYIN